MNCTGTMRPARRNPSAGWSAVCLALALGFLAPVGDADAVTRRDVEVALRTLSFVQDPPEGRVELAIIHAPDDPGSMREATGMAATLEGGLRIDEMVVVPHLVPVDRLEDLAGRRFAFLAGDLGGHADAVYAATRSHRILSIAFERSCVLAARCVMAVQSRPRVEVMVSREAATESRVEFAPAFRLMIIEI